MCGSDESHPYPVRSFTYSTEQVSANEVQRVMVYISFLHIHTRVYQAMSPATG